HAGRRARAEGNAPMSEPLPDHPADPGPRPVPATPPGADAGPTATPTSAASTSAGPTSAAAVAGEGGPNRRRRSRGSRGPARPAVPGRANGSEADSEATVTPLGSTVADDPSRATTPERRGAPRASRPSSAGTDGDRSPVLPDPPG